MCEKYNIRLMKTMFKSLVVFFICQQCVFGEFDSVVYLRRRTAAVRARSLGRSTPSVAPQSHPGSAALSVRGRSVSRADKSGAAGDQPQKHQRLQTSRAPERAVKHTHC